MSAFRVFYRLLNGPEQFAGEFSAGLAGALVAFYRANGWRPRMEVVR